MPGQLLVNQAINAVTNHSDAGLQATACRPRLAGQRQSNMQAAASELHKHPRSRSVSSSRALKSGMMKPSSCWAVTLLLAAFPAPCLSSSCMDGPGRRLNSGAATEAGSGAAVVRCSTRRGRMAAPSTNACSLGETCRGCFSLGRRQAWWHATHSVFAVVHLLGSGGRAAAAADGQRLSSPQLPPGRLSTSPEALSAHPFRPLGTGENTPSGRRAALPTPLGSGLKRSRALYQQMARAVLARVKARGFFKSPPATGLRSSGTRPAAAAGAIWHPLNSSGLLSVVCHRKP